jgi:hypothetical protein
MAEALAPSVRTILTGTCRCGAVDIELRSRRDVADLPLLICSCEFCRRQKLRYTIDADGELRLAARGEVRRYAFDGETAAALVCMGCGVVIGAGLQTREGDRTALNLDCLAARAAFVQPPQALDYDTEPQAEKQRRRERTWTPTVWIDTAGGAVNHGSGA